VVDTKDLPLAIALSAAVPLHIMGFQAAGGPTFEDFGRAQQFSSELGERGDVLLFGGGRKGEAAKLFNETARALAVLAFVPGGVTIFGQHYESHE
jgi:hypothetical protein